jgi:hypothetical protein
MLESTASNRSNVVDFAEARARRAALARSASNVRRVFLWGWPATGQLLAAEFPLPAATSFSLDLRSL